MSLKPTLETRARAFFLSKVVTRIIKAPPIEVTRRHVGKPEVIAVPTRHGDVRCFVTRPAADAPLAHNAPRPPVHVNIHGGAFLIGAPRQDDHIVRAIAGEVGAVVVNVDYSTAPAARFPQALEECFDVVQWIARPGEEWDSGRISIGGGSAGANLALGVLELARREGGPQMRAAALVTPFLDASLSPETFVTDAGGAFVTPALQRTVQSAYFTDESQLVDPLASPALGDAEGLPPLLVISASRDSLLPQTEAYVAKAMTNGATVTYRCFEGVDHDFPVSGSKHVRSRQLEMTGIVCAHLLEHLA